MVLRIASSVAFLWRTHLVARAMMLTQRVRPSTRPREAEAAVAAPVAEPSQLFFTISSGNGMNSNQNAMIPIPMLELNRLQAPMSVPVPLRMSVEVVVFSPAAEKQAATFTF